jgi:hypothetical protein
MSLFAEIVGPIERYVSGLRCKVAPKGLVSEMICIASDNRDIDSIPDALFVFDQQFLYNC